MDNKGQLNISLIGTLGIAGVFAVIMVLIFSEVNAGINSSNVPTAASNLLDQIPLLIAVLAVVAIAAAMIFLLR